MTSIASSISSSAGNPLTSGASLFRDFTGITNPGTEEEVISETVSVGKAVRLLQAFVTCRQEGKWRLLIDGSEVASGRTGAAVANSHFSWLPYREASAGQVVSLRFLVSDSNKPATDLEAYLQAREIDA